MYTKMLNLINELNKASDAYYNGNDPIMTDAEWDERFDELKTLEAETGIIMSNSPTQNVGYEVKSELQKVRHEYSMLSLDKTKSLDELQKFSKGRPCVLSLKMDGLSIRLTYEDGNLVRAETRGNGEIGEDVTHNARVIKNIPLHINKEGRYIIDGECIITYQDFEKINAKLPDDQKYKNPRNLASGSIRQLDSKIAAERELRFIAWKVIEGDESNSYNRRLANAEIDLLFDIVPFICVIESSKIGQKVLNEMRKQAEMFGYPIDGLVLAYNNIKYGESLGITSKFPRSSLAFKYREDEETTTLRDIEWSMGKSGDLTPVAIFDTIELAGTEVSRASLHNVSIMKELYDGIWHEGMELVIKKSNEIIPYVVSASPCPELIIQDLLIPNTCPVCGSLTDIRKDNESEVLYCTNPECKGKLLGLFKTFVGRDYMNIDGLSEKTLELLINRGLITKFVDLYYLEAKDLQGLPGFGPKKINNLLKAIDNSRFTTLSRFIASLGIPLVGRSAGKIIAKKFLLTPFFESWKKGYHWSNLEGIGPQMEKSLNDYGSKHWDDIMDLLNELYIVEEEEETTLNSQIKDITFVITGKLQHFDNRKELVALIEKSGGKVASSVTKNTDVLINNDVNSTSSKNKKAKELGIPIWSEADFLKNVN